MAWPRLALGPGALCGGLILTIAEEVTVKPTALNSPPPLLRWFCRRTKNHTAIRCIGVRSIMLFTDGCIVLSDLELGVQLQKWEINMWQSKLILWWTATNKLM